MLEHDDRVNDAILRVSFKPGSNHVRKPRNQQLAVLISSHIDDGDVDTSMSAPGSSGRNTRYNPYVGRGRNQARGGCGGANVGGRSSASRRSVRGRPPVPLHFNRRNFPESSVCWYKVMIPHGGRYSKEYILKTLLASIAPAVFIPLNYEVRGVDSSFFVDDSVAAEKLANADRKITTIKGFKLLIKVKPGLPQMELNSTLKEKLKAAMVKRFNADLKVLDLSRFHTDPDLVDNYAVALFRPNMLSAVLDIMAENVPELTALDLSDNKLYILGSLSVLAAKVPNLRVLHVGKNQIRDMNHLNCLEGLRLEELVLLGNPLCDKYQDKNLYISEVRKRFPRVMKLDGADLSPPIVLNVNEDQQLPRSKGSCLWAEGMTMVRQFLELYFQLYDSDNREPLVNAYHNDATFSITSTYPLGHSSTTAYKLVDCITDSLKLLCLKDDTRRQRLLYQGKMTIVMCLSKLPKTQHDTRSFAVDLTLFTPQLITISVAGLFLEHGTSKNQPLMSFSRVFMIVPSGNGFCIINEELFVANATDEQRKAAFQTQMPAVMPPPTPVVAPQIPAVMPPPSPVVAPEAAVTSPQSILMDDHARQKVLQPSLG